MDPIPRSRRLTPGASLGKQPPSRRREELCRKGAASAASTASGTAGARPGEPGASITPRGRRGRVSQQHGGREARRTRGPNHAQLRQGLAEEEAVDEVLQVRGMAAPKQVVSVSSKQNHVCCRRA